ncbi:polyprenyl synthetase family protein [Streptomyces sp. NPDC090127]|uniref:polyprenyl synthetase family protein n=1 Tax=Streptomyces sp. NPDC090127 TaxID=3365953 RepID=UPI003810747A
MRTLDPLVVDRDVPAAVGLVLDEVLGRRLEDAAAADPLFAADLARRVAAFTLAGGRRRRSQLLWWAMRACGGGAPESGAALRAAAALELIQTCALIHDDVMDGSPLRRGRPSVHVAMDAQYGTARRPRPYGTFGGSAAVLAGDLALAWADDVFAEAVAATAHAREAGRVWRHMRTEMVAGQYLDLHAQATGSCSPGRALRTALLKTGLYSVAHPLVLGATMAGAPPEWVRALRGAGRCAGIAFQLRDDLRGAFGDPSVTGKPTGEDLREGKATYLVAVARARCARRGDGAGLRLLDEVVGSSNATEDELRRVRDVLVSSGARDQVVARTEQLRRRAATVLDGAGLPAEATARVGRLLTDLCDPAVERTTGTESGTGSDAGSETGSDAGSATGLDRGGEAGLDTGAGTRGAAHARSGLGSSPDAGVLIGGSR